MATASKKITRSFLATLLSVVIAGCASAPPSNPTTVPTPAYVPKAESVANYEKNSEATYRIDIASPGSTGHGSGTVISTEGYILTVDHVVEHEGTVSILIQEGSNPPVNYVAAVVATDKVHDLAVLKINRRFADCVVLEDDHVLRPGDGVYTVGYPFTYGQMVARGHVQRLHYSDSYESEKKGPKTVSDQVLADFLTGPGGSGSGVFTESQGRLVGVMRLLVFQGEDPMTGMMVRGFVPIEQVHSFLETNRIPYVRSDGTTKAYPPLPTLPLAPSPATPANPAQGPKK